MITLVQVVVGLLLLTLGKRLFWLFVAAVGFVAALSLATAFVDTDSELVLFAIAMLAGFLGAMLAQFAQRVAVGVAGFLAGGYLTVAALNLLGVELSPLPWLPFLIGGLLGLILSYPLFDWALMVLSALIGALLLVQAVELGAGLALALTLALALVGVFLQAGWYRRLVRRAPE